MNYHDNEDELLRMQSRRRRAGSYGNVPSRSRASPMTAAVFGNGNPLIP
jgi:hypothetical protein